MIRIATVIGARPQFIKAASVSRIFRKFYADSVEELIIHTGQHYDEMMSDVFFRELEIPRPAFNLETGSHSHSSQIGLMMQRLEKVFNDIASDAVIVYGDANSTLAGSLVAAKMHLPLVHIEAGLRSWNKTMPEEINRIVSDHISTVLFTPTESGLRNLFAEGIKNTGFPPFTANNPAVINSGDVMLDSVLFYSDRLKNEKSEFLKKYQLTEKKYLLVTIHREENTDDLSRLSGIINGIITLARDQNIRVIWPLHPRTGKMLLRKEMQNMLSELKSHRNIDLTEPVSYIDMLHLEQSAQMVLTDSGGVQKEASFFGVPSVIIRSETEWPELIENQSGVLAGCNSSSIREAFSVLNGKSFKPVNGLFGNGKASEIICHFIAQQLF